MKNLGAAVSDDAAQGDGDNSRSLRFCAAFLRHRKIVVAVFVLGVVLSLIALPQVKVNYSLVDYLPQDAPSMQALDDMEESFGSGVPNARLYAEGIDQATAAQLADDFTEVDGVDEVMWLGSVVDTNEPIEMQDADTVDAWVSDDGYLFQLTLDAGKYVTSIEQVREVAADAGATQVSMDGDAVSTGNAQSSTGTEIVKILVAAILIIIVILLLTSSSWFEPVIFLTVIGVAIIMNMGSNIVLGEISFVTQICGAILQLAVSMDYAIVLLHTYRRQRRTYDDPEVAMAHAMKHGFSVVLSSAAVTFFGFLSLTVMRFGIGVNMGIVLAKGIVFSFLTVMFFMPCLILMCRKPMDRTEHRYLVPSFDKLARGCQKIMIPTALIVVLLVVPCYLAQENNEFVFGSGDFAPEGSQVALEQEHIEEAFGASETWVVMVPEGEWGAENELLDDLEDIPEVTGVTSYLTVAGQALPVEVVPEDTLDQVISNGWSRIVLTLDIAGESDASFGLVEQVREVVSQHYGDDYGLVGNMVSTYDLRETVQEDSGRVQMFSMLSIGIVLALMFRSLSIPIIMLLAIKCSTWINLAVPYFTGTSLNYIGYLVIDAVMLGAAVDYAIIYAREYFERRQMYGPRGAARSAIKHGGVPIITSGSILMFAGLAVWMISSNGIISEIGELLMRGALIAVILMFVFLPCLFRIFDWVIRHTTLGLKFCTEDLDDDGSGNPVPSAQAREARKKSNR